MEGGWPVGVFVQPMVDLAIKRILYEFSLSDFADLNSNLTLMPNHKIQLIWNNTKCAASPALAAAVWQFTTFPELVGVIGEGCSVASEPIALLGGVYAMPQISYGNVPLRIDSRRRLHFPPFV